MKKTHNHILSHTLWLLVNILLAGALGMSCLGMWISPSLSRLPALAGLVFPWLVWANILMAITWLMTSRKKWALLSLLTLIAATPAVLATYSHGSPEKDAPQEPQHTLRLLTYNTHLTQMVRKTPDNDVLRYIRESDADVVCLQEYEVRRQNQWLTGEEARQYLRSEYPYTDFQFAVESRKRQYGLAVYSKYPIVASGRIAYESAANSSGWVDVVVEGDTVRFINNHLESNSLTEKDLNFSDTPTDVAEMDSWVMNKGTRLLKKLSPAYLRRVQQAEAVRRAIDESPYPVVVCGDFNDVPVSYTYRVMRFRGQNLHDAFLDSSYGRRGVTFLKHGLGIRIDYILLSPTIRCVQYVTDRVNYSDHMPVRATLQW